MDEWVRSENQRRGRSPAGSDGARTGDRVRAGTAGRPDAGAARAALARAALPRLPGELATEIRRAAERATAHHREVLVERMGDAVAAYDRGRYEEAWRLGSQLAREVPTVVEVRRIAGFAAYRLGRWRDALRHLEAYGELSGEIDAVPAVMDCQRALGKHRRVAETWAELRRRSPDADVLAEARMVAAGSLADRGDIQPAVELLASAGAARALRNPAERHLRQWYALADLYERAGDVPKARELFMRVARVDPEAYDVDERLASLGRVRTKTPRPRGPRPSTGVTSPARRKARPG